ncbi:MAG TPA: PAS domain S-box protein [Bacteroidota bacterium]|nr:PAS domain S-box protein [Bacteroidota bacterium]
MGRRLSHRGDLFTRRRGSVRPAPGRIRSGGPGGGQPPGGLKEHGPSFEAIAEGLPAAVFIVQGTKIRYVNPAMVKMTGYTRRELQVVNFWQIAHTEDRVLVRARGLARQQGGIPSTHYEFRMVTKSGQQRWVDCIDSVVPLGGKTAVVGTLFDLTERKELEHQLRVSSDEAHRLAARINSVRQEQASTIAQRIHDELGPIFVAIRMNLDVLSNRVREAKGASRSAARQQVRVLNRIVEHAFRTLRGLTISLKPQIPDISDLPYLLEWMAKGFTSLTGIPCHVQAKRDAGTLSRQQASAVFLIIQEALTNIARHSRAHTARILLSQTSREIEVKVIDNGRGIGGDAARNPLSLGILGMQERARQLRGTLALRRRDGGGTVVDLRFPRSEFRKSRA